MYKERVCLFFKYQRKQPYKYTTTQNWEFLKKENFFFQIKKLTVE